MHSSWSHKISVFTNDPRRLAGLGMAEMDSDLTAVAGLLSIRAGTPYFSLTGSITVGEPGAHRRTEWGGGAIHTEILAAFPALAPIARLHLSDENGVPMHAEANGWYWLSGVWEDTGDRYTPSTGSQPQSPEGCLAIFAEYVRVSEAEARSLASTLQAEHREGIPARRAAFAAWIESQRPRWAAEAAAGKALLEQIAVNKSLAYDSQASAEPVVRRGATPGR